PSPLRPRAPAPASSRVGQPHRPEQTADQVPLLVRCHICLGRSVGRDDDADVAVLCRVYDDSHISDARPPPARTFRVASTAMGPPIAPPGATTQDVPAGRRG